MKLDTFFQKFDQFADAPGAVAKMRELVLELAVQGKLSEQRAADAKEPAWLKLAMQLDVDSNPDIEPPFEIPSWWRWTTLDRLGDTKPRNDAPDSAKSSFIPMTLIPAEYGQSARHEERPWGDIKKGYTHFKNGDVVMAKITPCFENGKSAVMNGLTGGFGAGTTELHVFRRTDEGVLPEFVILYLKTRGLITRGIPRMTGSAGQKRVPSDYFAKSPFPLPPIAEQKRIVAKVDELMALCDRLEAQQQERETRHTALARASLARFADAPTPANLHFLFHPSYAIPPADLRKSILTLAVQGKLVPQDPNDESAVFSSDAPSDLVPYNIPCNWRWIRLADVAQFINGDRSKNYPSKSYRVADGVPFINAGHLSNGDVSLEDMDYITEEHFERLGGGKVERGDVLYCLRGSLGKCSVVSSISRGAIASSLVIIRPREMLLAHFLRAYLVSPLGGSMIAKYDNGSAQPNLSASNVKRYLLPLPPLAEQRRIVAKVDQLMALVDELETQLTASRTTGTSLMEAVVAELTAQA